MKQRRCDLARVENVNDDQWRLHASGCTACGEVMSVAGWMNRLAVATPPERGLPAPGFLLAKARIRKRLEDADRANQPVRAMVVAAGILLTALSVRLFVSDSRSGSVMIDALSLIASFAGLILLVAIVTAGVLVLSGYLMGRPSS